MSFNLTTGDYCIQMEHPGFSVWSCSYATGSKQDCLGLFRDRREARRFIRRLRSRKGAY